MRVIVPDLRPATRTVRRERARPQRESRVPAPPLHAGPGRDFDTTLPDLMELGRKRIAAHDDARDLIAGREASAGEAIHANRGPGTGYLLEHPPQLLFVVGQLVDLGLAEGLRQRPGFFFGRRDLDVGLDIGDGQLDRDLMGGRQARRNRDVLFGRGEAFGRHNELHVARRSELDQREALVVGPDIAQHIRPGEDDDLGTRNGGAGGILDAHPHLPILSGRGDTQTRKETHEDKKTAHQTCYDTH